MKKDTAYGQIAHDALLAWGMADSDEKAWQIVENSTYDELENNYVYGYSSIHSAIEALDAVCFQGKNPKLLADLERAILAKDEAYLEAHKSEIEAAVSAYVTALEGKDVNKVVLYSLGLIHDAWVVKYASKFNQAGREGKKYQHLPLEMIGWKEAKADLLFLKPILSKLSIEVDETALHVAYNQMVAKFYEEHGFIGADGKINGDAVAKEIAKGSEFYSALSKQNTAKDAEEAKLVAAQSSEKVNDCIVKKNDHTIK